MTADSDIEYRDATADDYEAVVDFTEETWADLDVEVSDYIPEIYHDWIEGPDKKTILADAGDEIAGIAQFVMLSEYEGWAQGMRVNPEFRGMGIGSAIVEALFEWGRSQGATVARNMVFSWNQAGLGQSRALGFEPVTEFRWLYPEPDGSGTPPATADPDAAWAYWSGCDARDQLRGLALDMDHGWALRDLTREMLARAASESALLTVTDETGTAGFSYRSQLFETEGGEGDGAETETIAEYGVAAWDTLDAGRSLLDKIAADAADCGADRTRVLIPETAEYVSAGAYLKAEIADEPDFVLAADLTGDQ
jgi:GNAT superfamily N-acetyltransferase